MNEAIAARPHRLIGSHPQWWLGGMLVALHAALAWGIDSLFARAMLLTHFGIFLMWQPVWRGERSLEARHAFVVIVVGIMLTGWNNWWLMAVWLAVLFALIGGNLIGSEQPRQRFAALLAALYLLSLLLIWVVPHLFADQIFDAVQTGLVRWGLPLLPLVIVLVPAPERTRSSPLTVDLFYSVMLFLLVTGLVLGSFVVKQVSHGDYALALAQSLMVMAMVLMTLSWLWNPRSGFMGLGHVMSRYLMSLGLPFERWVKGLADLAEREREPERFLQLALQELCALPWISGVIWRVPHGSGEMGRRSRFQAEYSFQDLTLTFHTNWSLSPALLLHLKLLTQMLGHFHQAKVREEVQRQNAYTQAIHETGARLTHDVKNLLQSLRSLCSAADSSSAGEAAALQALVKRQLPQIAQRLTTTLEKLQAPGKTGSTSTAADAWWNGLKQRYTRSEINFSDDGRMAGLLLPVELFDSVAENLLQNAIAKSQQRTDLRITVRFSGEGGGTLQVCDSGEMVSPSIAGKLLLAPVPSQNGLGVGLYHAARQAEQLGYRLELCGNRAGSVCFRLAKAASAP
jgi:signal transduction histidine kinase